MPASPSTNSSAEAASFRFRPRFRSLALGAMAMGATVVAGGATTPGVAASYAMAGGGVVVVLGLLYLLSPAWRLIVMVDEDSLAVVRGGKLRFRLPWSEVVRVVASASTKTCFVDGGAPERSLLVPGPGASASYDIEDKAALYEVVIEHVSLTRIEWVDLLETGRPDLDAIAAHVPEEIVDVTGDHTPVIDVGAGAQAGAAAGADTGAGAGQQGADATADRESGRNDENDK
jgi:hypothetical protein